MLLIQERYSTNGFLLTTEIDVIKIKKANVTLPHTRFTHVIWVNNRQYPIIFRNEILRDKAYDEINNSLTEKKDVVTLSLENFFMRQLSDDAIKNEIKKRELKFHKHIWGAAQTVLRDKVKTGNSVGYLRSTDAFALVPRSTIKKIIAKNYETTFSNEQIEVFSKTLRYPKELHEFISPYDFWRNLYELHELRRAGSTNSNTTTSAGNNPK